MNFYVLINCQLNKEKDVLEFIQKIPNSTVTRTYGAFDIVAKLYGQNLTAIHETINKIKDHTNVVRIDTLQAVDRGLKVQLD